MREQGIIIGNYEREYYPNQRPENIDLKCYSVNFVLYLFSILISCYERKKRFFFQKTFFSYFSVLNDKNV